MVSHLNAYVCSLCVLVFADTRTLRRRRANTYHLDLQSLPILELLLFSSSNGSSGALDGVFRTVGVELGAQAKRGLDSNGLGAENRQDALGSNHEEWWFWKIQRPFPVPLSMCAFFSGVPTVVSRATAAHCPPATAPIRAGSA